MQASLKEFLGIHAEQARLRGIEDEWTDLLKAIEPLTEGKIGTSAWHPMKLKSLRTFTLVARASGVQPGGMTSEAARRIDAVFSGNKRTANGTALRRLDELRAFPELSHLLPPRPIGFNPEPSTSSRGDLPTGWEALIAAWSDRVTKSGWDPAAMEYSDDHEGQAHVMRSALRTSLWMAVRIGLIDEGDAGAPAALLSDEESVCILAREPLAACGLASNEGRFAPRTARKYLLLLNQVRTSLGHDDALLRRILANNATARQGKRDDKCMTPKNRKFCDDIIEKSVLRRRLLRNHVALRSAAECILDDAQGDPGNLSGHRLTQLRMLGAVAAFVALEIGGAPIRVGNAMGLTCVGEDAQILFPARGRKPIEVLIPGAVVKDGNPIEFGIKHNRHGLHDTLTWYLRRIRPLFPHAEQNVHLFPAVRTPDEPLDEGYFGSQFATLMRTVVDLPMTPHQMRHGQMSLLLNAHPNEIEVIAHRIGDTAATLRIYYGWMSALTLVERGQDLLTELMDD